MTLKKKLATNNKDKDNLNEKKHEKTPTKN